MKSTISFYKAVLYSWIEWAWYLTLSVVAFLVVHVVIYPILFLDDIVEKISRRKKKTLDAIRRIRHR